MENANCGLPTVRLGAVRRISFLALLLALGPVVWADDSPEARRLDAEIYREGLRSRGLIELLELALAESPPQDQVEADILRREILLAVYEDASRSLEERQAALRQADDILHDLIAGRPKDPQALAWRLELGKSLLYRQGEPYGASVLYRGGSETDRRRLGLIMTEAIEVFDALLAAVLVEFDRLDNLSLAEYERLERRGHIERVEQMQPQAQAMRRWALFYRAIARHQRDPLRIDELRAVVDDLRNDTDLLTTPHEVSHYQCQYLLLAGMAARRLGDYPLAAEQLEEAVLVVERLADPLERRDLHWVVTLARLERGRTLRDSRRYQQALEEVEDFRAWISSTAPDNFGLKLVAALLESSVLRAQASRAAAAGNTGLARRLESRSLEPLMVLARQRDTYRDAVYSTIYETLDPGRDPATLHPFERCALIAGLLAEADAPGIDSARLLDRAIAEAEQLLANPSTLDPELQAEALYNLGVARHRRGFQLDAARSFLAAGRDFPSFHLAERAATLSVQTAWEVYQDPGLKQRPEVQDLYLEALAVLTEKYAQSSAATYWQFFRGQTLEEVGRFAEAARQYARVVADHEFYVQARFRHSRCLAQTARELAGSAEADPAELIRRAVAAIGAARQFIQQASERRLDAQDQPAVDRLIAQALVNQAEMSVLPGVERNSQALEVLEGFEQRYADSAELVGRVLRVRVIAYQALGRLSEAEQAIPKYVESDPASAGATLQGLFNALSDEVERLRRAGREEQARDKAESALLLAREIEAWARQPASGMSPRERRALRVQLARAHLDAGNPAQARRLFAECLDAESAPGGESTADTAGVVFGLAEALFQLGHYSEALPLYNRLCRKLPPATPLWWQVLLGDLRCRTELSQDPAGVVQVIRQHRFLHPEMGGAELRARFDALLEQNQKLAETNH